MPKFLILGLLGLSFFDLIQPGNIWNSGLAAFANPIDLITSIVPLADWKSCPSQKVMSIPSELIQTVISRSNNLTDLKSKFGEPYCKKDNYFYWQVDMFGYKNLFIRIVFDPKKKEITGYEFYQ